MSTPPLAPPLTSPPALRCFVVEDSPLIRDNLVATLEEMLGATVVGTAEDQAGALRWAAQARGDCDVMVIDIFLKAGSGLEVLRLAKPLQPRAKMVVLTNHATTDIRRRCLRLGADRVFDKSAELDDLLAYCAHVASVLKPAATPIRAHGPPMSRR